MLLNQQVDLQEQRRKLHLKVSSETLRRRHQLARANLRRAYGRKLVLLVSGDEGCVCCIV